MKPRALYFSDASAKSIEPNFTNSEVDVSHSSISPSKNQISHKKHDKKCFLCEVKGSMRNIRKIVQRELSHKYSNNCFMKKDKYLDQILKKKRSKALLLFKEIIFDSPKNLLLRFYFFGELSKKFMRIYKNQKFMLLIPKVHEPSNFLLYNKHAKGRKRDDFIRKLISNIPESLLDQLDPEKISEYEISKTYLLERPDSSMVTPLLKELEPVKQQLISPTAYQNYENIFFNLDSKGFSEGEGFNEKSLCSHHGLNQKSSNSSFLQFCKLRRQEVEPASRFHSIDLKTSINIKNRDEQERRRADIQDNQTFPKGESSQNSNPEKMIISDQLVFELLIDDFPQRDVDSLKRNNQPVIFSDVSKIKPEVQSNAINKPLLNFPDQTKVGIDKEQSNFRPIIQKAVQSLTFNTQFNTSSNSKNFENVELQISNAQGATYNIDEPFNGILYKIQRLQNSSTMKLAGRKESDALLIDIGRNKPSSHEQEIPGLKLVQQKSSKQTKNEKNIIKIEDSYSVKKDLKSPVITSNRNSTRLDVNKVKSGSKSNSNKVHFSAEVKSRKKTLTSSIKKSELKHLRSAQTQRERFSVTISNLVNNTSKINCIKLMKKVGIRKVNSNRTSFRKDVKIIPRSSALTNLNTVTTSKKPEEPFAPKLISSSRNQTQKLFKKHFPQNKLKEERAYSSNIDKRTKTDRVFPPIISQRLSIKIENYDTYSSKNACRKLNIHKKSNLPEVTSALPMPNLNNFQPQNPKNLNKVSENLESQSLKHCSKNSYAKGKCDANFGIMSLRSNEQFKVYLHVRKSFNIDSFKPFSFENYTTKAKNNKPFSRTNHFPKKLIGFESKESK